MLGLSIGIPGRQKRLAGRHACVDGVPFELPVRIEQASAVMAAFSIDAGRAANLLPGHTVHPFRWLGNRGLLVVTAVDYEVTSFGTYVEQGLMIACTRGTHLAPPLLPLLQPRHYGLGLYVIDLPVSTERSAKAGKSIWGLPKHRARLDFRVEGGVISSQYDVGDRLACRIDVERPPRTPVRMPFYMEVPAYSTFRGMLMRSRLYVRARLRFALWRRASARLVIGDLPRVRPLEMLEIAPDPIFAIYAPQVEGVLDDRVESWFLTHDKPPDQRPEGWESIADLSLSEEALPPPDRLTTGG